MIARYVVGSRYLCVWERSDCFVLAWEGDDCSRCVPKENLNQEVREIRASGKIFPWEQPSCE